MASEEWEGKHPVIVVPVRSARGTVRFVARCACKWQSAPKYKRGIATEAGRVHQNKELL